MTIVDTFGYGTDAEEGYGFSQAVRVDDTVYVSGQFAHDAEGRLVGEGDVVAQFDATFANLDRVLAHFGATRRQIVETTVLVVDLRGNFAATGTAHSAYFGGHRPASTALGVVDLALPGQLVEVAAVIRLDVPT